jgi:battenin
MLLVALTPSNKSNSAIAVKLFGVVVASLSSGGGELSFLGLTHYYGHFSLAAWGSGTGGAGLVGAGLYVLLTTSIGFSVAHSLLASAFLPAIMLISFFLILPHGPLNKAKHSDYSIVPEEDRDFMEDTNSTRSLSPSLAGSGSSSSSTTIQAPSVLSKMRRAKALFFPYMLPLLLVYIAEYSINQGVAVTLFFPIASTPFHELRDFYPFYNLLYQIGVFIARSSTPFIRMRHLYVPSFLQVANLAILTSQAMFDWIPSVYLVFVIIFWEGLLGGAVYVNTFAEILENVPEEDREFSLGATSVSDSGGICIASFIGMALEVGLCDWQVARGRDWCKKVSGGA